MNGSSGTPRRWKTTLPEGGDWERRRRSRRRVRSRAHPRVAAARRDQRSDERRFQEVPALHAGLLLSTAVPPVCSGGRGGSVKRDAPRDYNRAHERLRDGRRRVGCHPRRPPALPALPSQAPPPPSALPLRLTGILFDQAQPERSACLIRCVAQPGRQGIYLVGERACDLAEVREILKDAIVIENLEAKRLERLTFPGVTSPAAVPPPAAEPVEKAAPPEPVQVVLPPEAVQTAIANLPELLSSAFAVPRCTGMSRAVSG
ncbi:MAG: hypothetical protein MZV70_42860 [Desulfobacterales bacterium]|nr:hypothetical protein [Desulfobacterales bacterium]